MNKKYRITIRFDESEFNLIIKAFEEEKNKHTFDWYSYSLSKYIRDLLINHCLCLRRMSDNVDNV